MKKRILLLAIIALSFIISSAYATSIGASLTVGGAGNVTEEPYGAAGAAVPSQMTVHIDGQVVHPYAILPGEDLVISLNVTEEAFSKLVITASQLIDSGTITIKYDDCGNHQPPEDEAFYDCASITLDGIKPAQYSQVYLYFKVSKQQINDANIDISTIGVTKFDDGTSAELPINKVAEDNDYIYYSASFTNFSNFIIHYKSTKVIVQPFNTDWLFALLAALVIFYLYSKSKKKQKRRRR